MNRPKLFWIVNKTIYEDYEKALIAVNQRDLLQEGIEND